ncbi:MAG: trigger factor [Flavobacteriales bacterium]|nr:trigger factor [Flavobacteriales bacterium]
MNIQKNQLDPLNAVITIEVNKADYAEKVEKTLTDYRKNANIPGFRKGHVPMSLIKKQYGKAVLFDEVNKLLQDSLQNYIQEEKLELLGSALPKATNEMNFDQEDFSFDFEIGLAPSFEVDLGAKNKITHYQVVPDKKMLEDQVSRIQKHYGKVQALDAVENGADLNVTFLNENEGINQKSELEVEAFEKKVAKQLVGKKIGDSIEVSTKDLFDDEHKLMDFLKIDHDRVHGLDVPVTIQIDNITKSEKAALNQELFDKIFPAGTVSSEKEMVEKIKEDAIKQFQSFGDNKFVNEVTDFLLENTKFDLPKEFLIKWLQTSGEKELTEEEASAEYERSEKGIRYQLIEGKLFRDHNLQVTFEDIKNFTSDNIRAQMAQFGMMDPSQEEVDNIVRRVLTNQDEVKRISDELVSKKITQLFMEKVPAKKQEIGYNDFIKLSYGE